MTSKSEKIRIRLKAYEHQVLDLSAAKIIDTAKRTGAKISGPIPLPTEKEVVTIIKSPHKHKRLIDVLYPTQKTIESLTKLDLPAGVEIEIKL